MDFRSWWNRLCELDHLGLFGFGLVTCFWCGLTGWMIPTGWPYLSVTLPFLTKFRLNLFLAWAILALAWAPVLVQGVYDVWRIGLLSAAFLLGTSREPRGLFIGMALGMWVSCAVSVAQWLGHSPVVFAANLPFVPAGLFFNPDIMGEVACLISIYLIIEGMWWPLVGVLPCLAMSESRVALCAFTATLAIFLWRRLRWYGLAITTITFLVLGTGLWLSNKTLSLSLTPRIALWEDTLDGLTLWGRGPGSFMITYPIFAARTDTMDTRPENAHNDYLELWYQYGPGSLIIVPVLATAIFSGSAEGFVVLGFALIALLSFPAAMSVEGFIGAYCMGRCWGMDGSKLFCRRLARFLWLCAGKLRAYRTRSEGIPVVSRDSHGPGLLGQNPDMAYAGDLGRA